jgi:hypothetical protein
VESYWEKGGVGSGVWSLEWRIWSGGFGVKDLEWRIWEFGVEGKNVLFLWAL